MRCLEERVLEMPFSKLYQEAAARFYGVRGAVFFLEMLQICGLIGEG